MNAPIKFPSAFTEDAAPACHDCGCFSEGCECVVTCGRCAETVWRGDARFYSWLGRDGKHVCHACEHEMDRAEARL